MFVVNHNLFSLLQVGLLDLEVNNQTKVLFLAVLALSILMMCLKVREQRLFMRNVATKQDSAGSCLVCLEMTTNHQAVHFEPDIANVFGTVGRVGTGRGTCTCSASCCYFPTSSPSGQFPLNMLC